METPERTDLDTQRRCGAETRDGTPCQKYPASGATRCRFHGGGSTGPRDPSVLEDNDHAEGNDGGPPEGNTNALISGAFVPLDRIPELLLPEQLHGVARWEYYAVLVARERRPDLSEGRRRRLAARWARLDVRETTASVDAWCDPDAHEDARGFIIERERTFETEAGEAVTVTEQVANPSLGQGSRARRERRDVADILGIYDHDAPRPDEAECRAAPPLPDVVEAAREGRER